MTIVAGGLPEHWLVERVAADIHDDAIAKRYVRGTEGFVLAATTKVSEL